MKKFILLLVFLSLNVFANNQEIERLQSLLRAEVARLQAAGNVTIVEVDALAAQFIYYLTRFAPTDRQLQNFRERLGQILGRVPVPQRNGRTIESYEQRYFARAQRASLVRASVSMQRAQSVSAAVTDVDAWRQIYADYLPRSRNNGRTVGSLATVLRTVLGVLANNDPQRLGLLTGNRLEDVVAVAQAFQRFALAEIESAMNAGQANPDAPRAFEARMQGLVMYAQRLNLNEVLNQARGFRELTTSSVRYQTLLGNAQQILNQARAARSVSRVPGISNARTTLHARRRERNEDQQPGNQAPALPLEQFLAQGDLGGAVGTYSAEQIVEYYNAHGELALPRELRSSFGITGRMGNYLVPESTRDSGVSARAALSIVSIQYPTQAVLRTGGPVAVNPVENAGGGNCLFYALGTDRQTFVHAIEQNIRTNQNLGAAFTEFLQNNPRYQDVRAWANAMRVQGGALQGGQEELALWHALTGIPVREFRLEENGTWNERRFYGQYTLGQQGERWIGYTGDDVNGHWVELQAVGTIHGSGSGGAGNSTGSSGATGNSDGLFGLFGWGSSASR